MRLSSLITLLICIITMFPSYSKEDDFLKSGKLKDIIIREVANLNLSTTIKLLEIDKIKGLGVGIKYNYEMTPSYLKGKFARVDEWRFNRSVNPGSFIDAVTPVNLSFAKEDKVTFIRHFESQKKAIFALPYAFNKLPFDAESTLKRLNIGDFVSIPARMSLNIGVSANFSYTDIVDAGAYANIITTGNYIINIYRVDEKKVRLKIVTRTSNEAMAGAKIKSDFFVSVLEKTKAPDFITKRFELKFFDYGLARGIGEQYILDYVFDLSNEKAREAYDLILKPKFKLDMDKIFAQYTGRKYMEEKLISDFSKANELATLGTGVELLFHGFNSYKYKRRGLKLGVFVTDINYGMTYYKNNISILNGEDRGEYFLPNKVYRYSEEFDILIHKRKDKIEESFFSFIPKDREQIASIDFGTNYQRKDRYFTRGEWKFMKRKIKALIPRDIFLKIDFSDIEKIKTNITTEIKYRLVFRKEIFKLLENVTLEEIINEVNKIKKDRGYRSIKVLNSGNHIVRKVFFWQRTHTKYVAKRIYRVLASNLEDVYKKLENVIDNIDKNDFRKYFYRVVQSLVPISKLPDLMHFKLDILGNRSIPVHFKYGDYEFPKKYYEIIDINRDFHDSKRDLQIITE